MSPVAEGEGLERVRILIWLGIIGAIADGAWWVYGRGPEVAVATPTRGSAVEIV
jgi:hypothetical protein